MKICVFFTLFLMSGIAAFCCAGTAFAPEPRSFFSGSSLQFRHYFYVGSECGHLVNHGNLGVDFPMLGFSPGKTGYCQTGIAAAAHLVMFPENMKFAVDNFYATLAVFADLFRSERTSCRIYPVYHVSGHLADGSKNDSALTDASAVSSEMALFELSFAPVPFFSVSAGYGYYYHVCAQQGLTDRFEMAFRFLPYRNEGIRPYAAVTGLFLQMNGWHAGADIEAGVRYFRKGGGSAAIALRFFNNLHPGYYFGEREKSAGLQMELSL